MKYNEDRHECTIDLLRFCELLGSLIELIKEEVWNYHVLDKHRETIEDNIAERIDIWNDPDQNISALCQNVKSYMVIINQHTQSNESRVQDIALWSSGGWSEGDPLSISTIRSVRLSSLHTILVTSYKSKKKQSGKQNQGPGIYGYRVVKYSRAKIRQAQK